MTVDSAKEPEHASVRDLVVYLARRTHLNATRLQKLIYLVEAEYADKHGRRLLSYPYYYDHYGMNSVQLESRVLEIARSKDAPFTAKLQDRAGGVGFDLKLAPETEDPALPDGVKAACDFILKEYAKISGTVPLSKAAKQTLPFWGTERGAKVDWTILTDSNLRGDCDEKLSEKGRKRLQSSFATVGK
jgi:hypothetical protein